MAPAGASLSTRNLTEDTIFSPTQTGITITRHLIYEGHSGVITRFCQKYGSVGNGVYMFESTWLVLVDVTIRWGVT
jgi:hypothetical protein